MSDKKKVQLVEVTALLPVADMHAVARAKDSLVEDAPELEGAVLVFWKNAEDPTPFCVAPFLNPSAVLAFIADLMKVTEETWPEEMATLRVMGRALIDAARKPPTTH